jgi:hypothetical protein
MCSSPDAYQKDGVDWMVSNKFKASIQKSIDYQYEVAFALRLFYMSNDTAHPGTGAFNRAYISTFDGLRYVRLTALGAYVCGLSPQVIALNFHIAWYLNFQETPVWQAIAGALF